MLPLLRYLQTVRPSRGSDGHVEIVVPSPVGDVKTAKPSYLLLIIVGRREVTIIESFYFLTNKEGKTMYLLATTKLKNKTIERTVLFTAFVEFLKMP